jgi:hypothetical protein
LLLDRLIDHKEKKSINLLNRRPISANCLVVIIPGWSPARVIIIHFVPIKGKRNMNVPFVRIYGNSPSSSLIPCYSGERVTSIRHPASIPSAPLRLWRLVGHRRKRVTAWSTCGVHTPFFLPRVRKVRVPSPHSDGGAGVLSSRLRLRPRRGFLHLAWRRFGGVLLFPPW